MEQGQAIEIGIENHRKGPPDCKIKQVTPMPKPSKQGGETAASIGVTRCGPTSRRGICPADPRGAPPACLLFRTRARRLPVPPLPATPPNTVPRPMSVLLAKDCPDTLDNNP